MCLAGAVAECIDRRRARPIDIDCGGAVALTQVARIGDRASACERSGTGARHRHTADIGRTAATGCVVDAVHVTDELLTDAQPVRSRSACREGEDVGGGTAGVTSGTNADVAVDVPRIPACNGGAVVGGERGGEGARSVATVRRGTTTRPRRGNRPSGEPLRVQRSSTEECHHEGDRYCHPTNPSSKFHKSSPWECEIIEPQRLRSTANTFLQMLGSMDGPTPVNAFLFRIAKITPRRQLVSPPPGGTFRDVRSRSTLLDRDARRRGTTQTSCTRASGCHGASAERPTCTAQFAGRSFQRHPVKGNPFAALYPVAYSLTTPLPSTRTKVGVPLTP